MCMLQKELSGQTVISKACTCVKSMYRLFLLYLFSIFFSISSLFLFYFFSSAAGHADWAGLAEMVLSKQRSAEMLVY